MLRMSKWFIPSHLPRLVNKTQAGESPLRIYVRIQNGTAWLVYTSGLQPAARHAELCGQQKISLLQI